MGQVAEEASDCIVCRRVSRNFGKGLMPQIKILGILPNRLQHGLLCFYGPWRIKGNREWLLPLLRPPRQWCPAYFARPVWDAPETSGWSPPASMQLPVFAAAPM